MTSIADPLLSPRDEAAERSPATGWTDGRRPHVLIAFEGLPYPVDVRVRAQTAALLAAGCRVTVAGPSGFGHETREENLDGVRVLRYRAAPGGRGALGYLREYGVAWLALRRILRRVAREDPVDVAIVCNPPDALAGLTAPLCRRGTGLVFDYREISPELYEAKFRRRGPLYRLLLRSERRALARADAVITVSEPCVELVRRRGDVPAERIFLVGNGPDPERIYPVAPRPELRRGHEHLVLWLGAMSTQEGLERLVEAAAHVAGVLGRHDVLFALVGPGDAHEALRAEVRRRGLEDVVLVTGAVNDDEVRAYMATADVCVGVDERNAMNDRAAMRKILEYMTMGRPVVQFPLTEMRRLCGDTCVYARDADPVDLAERVVELLDDPDRRRHLGAAAQRRAHGGLMWPQQIPALLAAVACARDRGVATPTAHPEVIR